MPGHLLYRLYNSQRRLARSTTNNKRHLRCGAITVEIGNSGYRGMELHAEGGTSTSMEYLVKATRNNFVSASAGQWATPNSIPSGFDMPPFYHGAGTMNLSIPDPMAGHAAMLHLAAVKFVVPSQYDSRQVYAGRLNVNGGGGGYMFGAGFPSSQIVSTQQLSVVRDSSQSYGQLPDDFYVRCSFVPSRGAPYANAKSASVPHIGINIDDFDAPYWYDYPHWVVSGQTRYIPIADYMEGTGHTVTLPDDVVSFINANRAFWVELTPAWANNDPDLPDWWTWNLAGVSSIYSLWGLQFELDMY